MCLLGQNDDRDDGDTIKTGKSHRRTKIDNTACAAE